MSKRSREVTFKKTCINELYKSICNKQLSNVNTRHGKSRLNGKYQNNTYRISAAF